MKKFLLVLFILLFYSCSEKRNDFEVVSTINHFLNDTLYPPHQLKSISCSEVANQYSNRAGIVISNFYEIIEEKQLDIDHDNFEDSLIILSPINKMPSNEPCPNELDANRILLIQTRKNIFLYDNVIWNKWGHGSQNADHIEWACSEKGAFSLQNYFGQSCFFEYTLCLSMSKSKILLDSILIRSGCNHKQIRKVINDFHRPFYIENYKTSLVDSLKEKYRI